MDKRLYLPIAAAVLFAIGCSHVDVKTYSGVIQRVETGEFLGYTVSPVANSASSLVHPVHVFVGLPGALSAQPRVVRIDFLDVSDPTRLGKAGDGVTFVLRGELPTDGHIAAEAVSEYAVGNARPEQPKRSDR